MQYISLLEKALRFAAVAHKHQTRKSSDVPYIYHPFAVFAILQHYHYPTNWCITALLHDTLEDTTTTNQQLIENFGEEISRLVRQTSEPDHAKAPWIDRKTHTINFLRSADLPVKIIACADKLHNLHSVQHDLLLVGDLVWQRFNEGKDMQQWYHENILANIQQNVKPLDDHPIISEYEKLISKIFHNA